MNTYDGEKSDPVIVSKKVPNNESDLSAEVPEKRTEPKGNSCHEAMVRTQSRGAMSNGLAAVRQTARKRRRMKFTALLHHMTIDLLRKSYLILKRNSAAGIDGITWKTYGNNLEKRLKKLHNQIHKGATEPVHQNEVIFRKLTGAKDP